MTKEDIMQALRLTAMGRYGHPLQEQLAERLVLVFDRVLGTAPDLPEIPDGSVSPADTPLMDAAKRRARKAE